MKIKKLLSGVLAGIMVLGTVSFSALAEDANVYEIGIDKAYATLKEAREAVAEDATEITYKIYGEIKLPDGEITDLCGKATNAETVNFVSGNDNAEQDKLILSGVSGKANYIGRDMKGKVKFVNYKNLTLDRNPEGGWINDAGHENNYFTTTIRNSESKVTYEGCIFPNNGSCNNRYGETIYTNCKFNNNKEYALWIYGGKTTVTGESNTFTGKKGVKLYSEDKDERLETTIENATFEITGKPAIVASTTCNLTVNNADTSNCLYGTVAAEPNNHGTQSENLFPEIKIDGETPKYTAKVGEMLCESEEFAKAEAGTSKTVEPLVATVGGKYFTTLKEAVESAKDGDVVELLKDANGDGIIINSTTYPINNLTIDFGGHTYTVDGMLVGSPGSETNGFQLLAQKNADGAYVTPNITFKNGTIRSSKKAVWGLTTANRKFSHGAMILIQNYSNLTLEDITLNGYEKSGSGFNPRYVVSNNNGHTVMTGDTNIIAGDIFVAFDVCAFAPYPSVSVTLDENMTGTIRGKVEFSNSGKVADSKDDFNLIIKNGTVIGDFSDKRTEEQKEVEFGAISGGSFTADISGYCEEGFTAKQDANGNWVIDESATAVTVGFKPVNARKYKIIVTAKDTNEINRLNTADITFKLTASNEEDSGVAYTITPASNISVVGDETNADRYVFYFNDKTNVKDTGKSITIGTVEFTGYTKNGATVSFETLIDKSLVTATTKTDNLVTYYGTDGDSLSAGTQITDKEFTVPTRKLTVNVKFPQKVTVTNGEAYQAMNVTISGPGVNESIDLGANSVDGDVYTVSKNLPENTAYTVTVSGDGYRTARYTVMLTKSKTLTFWNNVMTAEVNVEDGNGNSARKITFLAGDIVKDNKINIYDLSAVVSYFGTKADTSAKSVYAKYDLNRDGVIDSRDIAYVLASWGN